MFIQEKYLFSLSNPLPNVEDGGPILACKYCHREFMVPKAEVEKLTVKDVCESTECQKAHDQQQMAIQLEQLKAETNKVVNGLESNFKDELSKALSN